MPNGTAELISSLSVTAAYICRPCPTHLFDHFVTHHPTKQISTVTRASNYRLLFVEVWDAFQNLNQVEQVLKRSSTPLVIYAYNQSNQRQSQSQSWEFVVRAPHVAGSQYRNPCYQQCWDRRQRNLALHSRRYSTRRLSVCVTSHKRVK